MTDGHHNGTSGADQGSENGSAGSNGSGPAPEPQEPRAEDSGAQSGSTDTGSQGLVPAPNPAVDAPRLVVVAKGAPEADAKAVERYELTWEPKGKHWRNKDGKRICGAHPFSPKGPCRQAKLYGNGRCHHHGGPTPSGIASVHYRHGRWSRALKGRRSQSFLSAVDDPELLDLSRPLAIMDVQVEEAIIRREESDTPHFRKRALSLYKQAKSLLTSNPARAAQALEDLGTLLERGAEEDNARNELGRSASRMARHQEKALQIRLNAAQAVNASDLTAILGAFIEVAVQEMPEGTIGPFLARLDREVLAGRLAQQGVYSEPR